MSDEKPKGHDNKAVVMATPSSLRHNIKRLLLVLVGVTLLGLATFLLIRHFRASSSSLKVTTHAQCSTKPTSQVLQQAAGLFDATKQSSLEQVVTKVQKIPNYQQDPNCLYPVVVYYINISDAKKARLYLDKLTKVYDPKKGFSPDLGYNRRSIDNLQTTVVFMEKNADQVQKNMMTFGEPPGL